VLKKHRISEFEEEIESKMVKMTRLAWIGYLQKFYWNWHINLSFGNTVSANYAEKLLKRWVEKLKIEERLQVAGIALVQTKSPENVHIHALLISKDTPFNGSLNMVDKYKWEREWPHGKCVISTSVECAPAIFAKYIAKEKNMSLKSPDDYHLITIKPNLLNKLQNALSGRISSEN